MYNSLYYKLAFLRRHTAALSASAKRRRCLLHILGGTTCFTLLDIMRPRLYCVFCRIKDHHILPHYSSPLKNACVRQVVLGKWFPLRRAHVRAASFRRAERGWGGVSSPLEGRGSRNDNNDDHSDNDDTDNMNTTVLHGSPIVEAHPKTTCL